MDKNTAAPLYFLFVEWYYKNKAVRQNRYVRIWVELALFSFLQ